MTSYITLRIFDSLGKEVKELIDKELPVGLHEINFNAADLASGIYFYRIKSENFSGLVLLDIMNGI